MGDLFEKGILAMSVAPTHVVVVSGMAGNLGRAVAKIFDAPGADLVLLDRRRAKGQAALRRSDWSA